MMVLVENITDLERPTLVDRLLLWQRDGDDPDSPARDWDEYFDKRRDG